MAEQRPQTSTSTEEDCTDTVWSYQGYRLDPSHFTTAMVHLYRAEVQRANVWRSRLDTTTNWAVVTSAAALTFTFSAKSNPHFIMLLVLLLLLTFLNIEARRYRYYELWYRRLRILETNLFAPMVSAPFGPSPDWGAQLEENLLHPGFGVAWWEAVGNRLRRNYLMMITLLLIAWIIKLGIYPEPVPTAWHLIERAAIGGFVSGTWVSGVTLFVYIILIFLALLSAIPRGRRGFLDKLSRVSKRVGIQIPRGKPALATIITDKGSILAQQLIEELERGVTSLKGTGMYTGAPRDVLLCALTDVQIEQFKKIVHEVDPDAFVIVNSATQVRGGGFEPVEAPS